MDLGSLLGLISGVLILVIAMMSGGEIGIFINTPSVLIVIGGGSAATLIRFKLKEFVPSLKTGLGLVFQDKTLSPLDLIKEFSEMAQESRKKGLMVLENRKIADPFLKNGLSMAIDGMDIETIKQTMTRDKQQSFRQLEISIKIFRGLAESAPAFGMIGTLIGLVQMLTTMSDPATIGPSMAVALLTTLYGALLSNLVAIPLADKLESKVEEDQIKKNMISEGISLLSAQTNPRIIEKILGAYLPEKIRKVLEDEDEEDEVPAIAEG